MTWPSRRPQAGGEIPNSTCRDVKNNGALSSPDDFKKTVFSGPTSQNKVCCGVGLKGRQLSKERRFSSSLLESLVRTWRESPVC